MKTLWSDRVRNLDIEWHSHPHQYFFIKNKIQELYRLEPGPKKILDAGCGPGVLYGLLPTKIQDNYMGVDFTPEFIDICKSRYPRGDWRVINILELDLPNNSFYIVNSRHTLQHIEDWEKAARQLIRVSSKYVINTVAAHKKKTCIVSMEPVLRRRFNPRDLVELLSQFGEVSWEWINKNEAMFVTRLRER